MGVKYGPHLRVQPKPGLLRGLPGPGLVWTGMELAGRYAGNRPRRRAAAGMTDQELVARVGNKVRSTREVQYQMSTARKAIRFVFYRIGNF